jgi:multidrug efflux pump subunit AcrB
MQMSEAESGVDSRRFVIVFAVSLLLLVLAFWGMVRWAIAILPQEQEVITLTQAAQGIQANEYERILIQRDRDIFFYRPGEERPLYLQIGLTETFTGTMFAQGVDPGRFPPLIVESR